MTARQHDRRRRARHDRNGARRRRPRLSARPSSIGCLRHSSNIMLRISPTARGRSRSSKRRWSTWLARVIVSRSAPTSSNGSRSGFWTLSNSAGISRRFAVRTLSACKNPIRRCCRLPSSAPAASPHRAIMVGDSGTDIRTSRAATVPVIAVDFGYSEVPIALLRPDRIIGSFADLPGGDPRHRRWPLLTAPV